MTTLIISIIFCVVSVFVALYGYKRHIQATEKMERVTEHEKRLIGLSETPFSYCAKINLDRSCVIVGGRYFADGWFFDVNFKEFPFDPTDSEDKEFAIREAEELIEKLREK